MRDLKGRIGSVASSEKITGAMKMISSAKMHKAETALYGLSGIRFKTPSITLFRLMPNIVLRLPRFVP